MCNIIIPLYCRYYTDSRPRGIGAGIAALLGKRGANVVVNYTSPSSLAKAEEIVKEIQSHGSKAVACQANLRTIDDIPKLVKAALELSSTGKIEILVHKYVGQTSLIMLFYD